MNILLFEKQQRDQDKVVITNQSQIEHIIHVLKAIPGERIKVGQIGAQIGSAQVDSITSDQLVLCDMVLCQPPPAKLPVRLIVCLPRPKVLRRLIKDAVTLGVSDITLLHSYRVEKSYWQSPLLAQIERYIWEGLEQAGDTIWPIVHIEKRFKPFVEDRLPQYLVGRTAWVAHPYAADKLPIACHDPAVMILGPEGGFTEYELNILKQQGCHLVTLGSRILRCETAMTAVLSRLFAVF